MTIQNLIDAIAEALFREFGDAYEIYTEKVEQDLSTPCFRVRCLNPTKGKHVGRLYKRTNQFSVQYIPDSLEADGECNAVLERLFDCLEDVALNGKPIHGTDQHGEITDGILTFTVNYDGFVLQESNETNMSDVEFVIEAKG